MKKEIKKVLDDAERDFKRMPKWLQNSDKYLKRPSKRKCLKKKI